MGRNLSTFPYVAGILPSSRPSPALSSRGSNETAVRETELHWPSSPSMIPRTQLTSAASKAIPFAAAARAVHLVEGTLRVGLACKASEG